MNHEKDWLNRAIYFQWLTLNRTVARDYARQQVQKTVRMGAGIYSYFVQCGGPVIYDSALAPRASKLEYDLLDALVRECQAAGIKFVAGWLGTLPAFAREMREHPDWQTRGPAGEPLGFACFNSPMREYVFAMVKEVLSRYPVDGIYFDQLPTGCFCRDCQLQYELFTGGPMRFGPELKIKDWAGDIEPADGRGAGILAGGMQSAFCRFARAKKKAFLWELRRIINEVRPSTALIVNHLVGIDAVEGGAEYVDAPMPEVVAFSGDEQLAVSAVRTLTSLYAGGKPTWGQTKLDTFAQRPRPVIHAQVTMADAVANGNAILLRDQDSLDLATPRVQREFSASMSELCGLHQELSGARPVPYAAVLHSLATLAAGDAGHAAVFAGAFRTLVDLHLPFKVVTEPLVQAGALKDVRVLLLPDVSRLEAATLKAVRAHVQKGGGLVATGLPAVREPGGEMNGPGALHDLLGVKIIHAVNRVDAGAMRYEHPDIPIQTRYDMHYFYARARAAGHPILRDLAGALFSWEGDKVVVEAGATAEVLADIVGFDQAKLFERDFNRRLCFPGEVGTPFLVANTAGSGRCVYCAASVCQPAVRSSCTELDDLLAGALRWAAGEAPAVELQGAPMRLRLTVKQTPMVRYAFFNNCNTIDRNGIVGVCPAAEFTLTWNVRSAKVTKVEDHEGKALAYTRKGPWVAVTVPRVDAYRLVRLHVA